MQSTFFVFLCVVLAQLAYAASIPKAEKSVAQLHGEFVEVGKQLRANLTTARARADWRDDKHVQGLLNGVEESDQVFERYVTDAMDPKHPMSKDEVERLNNNFIIAGGKITAHNKLLKHNDSLIITILQKYMIRGSLWGKIVLKNNYIFTKQKNGTKESLIS